MIGLEYVLSRSGPMSMAPSQLGVYAKSDPRFATPNLQYFVQPLSLAAWGGELDPFPAFTASVANVRPDSRGAVHVRSSDPAEAPVIHPNYLSTESDRIVAPRMTDGITDASATRSPSAPKTRRSGSTTRPIAQVHEG
jgi:choline dehydrogenase-like flavoprotein